MIKKLCLIVLVLLNISTSLAGTRNPYVSDEKHLMYGKDFIYVGKLCGVDQNGDKFCASAVAIDDHNILTAAHVVNKSRSCFVYFEGKKYCICNIVVHKDFNPAEFGIADIAIGYSEESFGLNFYPDLYKDDDEIDKICCIAGYGFYGTFRSGAIYHDGQKRGGSNRIDSIEKDILVCSPSTLGDKKRTTLEFLIASGDSGGGLFIDNKLAGINSCIMAIDRAPSSKYNEESGHTRISTFVPWIIKYKK